MRFIYTKLFGYIMICVVITALLVFLQTLGKLDRLREAFLHAPRPVVIVATSTIKPVKGFFATLFSIKAIVRENGVLKNKVFQLQQELADLQQEKLENVALRKELGFVKSLNMDLVPCATLTQNVFDYTDTLVLNCGVRQGVTEGKAVISQGYLAGKIIYADENTSTVLLLTSSKFKTDARISKTGVNGVVNGSYSSGVILGQLPQDSTLEKGWLVVTAGLSEKIPKNILIGEVGEVVSGSNQLLKEATLVSPLDFRMLEFLFVIK